MRKNRSNEILKLILKNPSISYSVKEISQHLGISERQIRNYIRQINTKSAPSDIVLIDKSGLVRLSNNYKDYLNLFTEQEYLPKERISIILSDLLSNKEGINIFDLSEKLFVSRPTIESDINKIRKIISTFDISLHLGNDILTLNGSEKSFRRLTSFMIRSTEYEGFLPDNNTFLKEDNIFDTIRNNLVNILESNHFIYNDYSINNIVLHLIITIERIKNNYYIETQPFNVERDSIEIHAATDISRFFKSEFNLPLSDMEIENLAAFLACNLATVDYKIVNSKSIEKQLPEDCTELAHLIINKISDYYYLPNFDDIFFSKFLLHVNNLIKRLHSGFSAHNPLHDEVKRTFPFLYDTAIYAAEIIREETGYSINENEISLIALHIGGFLERNQLNKNKLSAIYVYMNYHDMYQNNIKTLQKRFGDQLNLQYTISYSDYNKAILDSDIIISEVPLTDTKMDVVYVSPFLTTDQLRHIDNIVTDKIKHKEKESFFETFQKLFSKDIFYKNIQGNNKYEILESVGDKLIKQGYIDEEFLEGVFNREKLSSTCFIDNLAIPHAISQNVNKSFISFTAYSQLSPWDEKKIRLMVIIGISYTDRKNFRLIFNQLVKLFENQTVILELADCNTYEEILDKIQLNMNYLD